MRRTVQWSRAALDDLKAAIRYIAEDSEDAARLVEARVRTTGERLGEAATGHPGRVTGVYEKLVARPRYILAYSIEREAPRETIMILRIIHASRDWRDESWPE